MDESFPSTMIRVGCAQRQTVTTINDATCCGREGLARPRRDWSQTQPPPMSQTHSLNHCLPPSLPPSLPHKVQLRGGRKPPRTRVPQARLFPRWRTSSPRERAPRSRTKTEALWSSWLARGWGWGVRGGGGYILAAFGSTTPT